MIRLVDVEPIAKEHPQTFHIPSREMRERLRAGELVKLHFESTETGQVERMWVAIRSVESDAYHGVLDSDPKTDMNIVAGAPVSFLPHHVSSVWVEPDHDWATRIDGPAHSFQTV